MYLLEDEVGVVARSAARRRSCWNGSEEALAWRTWPRSSALGRGAVSDTDTNRTTRVDGTLERLRVEALAGVLRAPSPSRHIFYYH